jgi:hypothetical protein
VRTTPLTLPEVLLLLPQPLLPLLLLLRRTGLRSKPLQIPSSATVSASLLLKTLAGTSSADSFLTSCTQLQMLRMLLVAFAHSCGCVQSHRRGPKA